MLAPGCSSSGHSVVSYDRGRGWAHSDEILQIGVTRFEGVEKYGPPRCAGTDLREGLLASGLVTKARTVDEALTRVLDAGLVSWLFGRHAGGTGGVVHDVVAGTVRGRRATIPVVGVRCFPDGQALPITLDLVGFPAHDGRDVVAVFLGGTLDQVARQPILDSIRVTP